MIEREAPRRSFDLSFFLFLCRRRARGYEEIIVTSVDPHLEVEASQLTEENEDFASRSRYHQTSTVHGRDLDHRPEDELALVP